MQTLTSTRQSGVLLHPTALPGPYGMGDLGGGARRFLDWLATARQQLWQVLPLNPTTMGASPYASPSAFAGNVNLISLDGLVEDGLLRREDLHPLPPFPAHQVDFGMVDQHRAPLFSRAFDAFRQGANPGLKGALEAFRQRTASWLPDYALYTALHRHFEFHNWTDWDADISRREPAALQRWRDKLARDVEREEFLQFLLAKQWHALREYAATVGVRIVGDIPIFVAYDSADVWAHRHLFKLDAQGNRQVVAGVPPDYFSEDGQLWGNPLYNWDAMAKDGYRWWIERIRSVASMVDIIRVDHFRGFAAAWEVPAAERTAKKGTWVKGPGRAVFDAIFKALGPIPFIAEDLGIITPDVEALRDGLKLPGMKILHFAFGDDSGDNAYLPHNHGKDCVVYTGTHDNDTTRGWFASIDQKTRTHVQRYLARDGHDISWDLIRAAWSSPAGIAVAPMQDVLDLGTEARFNVPGKAAGNWGWRFTPEMLHDGVTRRLADQTELYARTRITTPPKH